MFTCRIADIGFMSMGGIGTQVYNTPCFSFPFQKPLRIFGHHECIRACIDSAVRIDVTSCYRVNTESFSGLFCRIESIERAVSMIVYQDVNRAKFIFAIIEKERNITSVR